MPRPFTEQGAVAALLERSHPAAPAERAELREDHGDLGRQRGVDAAGQHHSAATAAQLVHRRVHRQQRRRAGRIEQVVRALEVESIGDAAGHHVGHQSRCDVGAARGQLGLQTRADLGQRRGVDRGAGSLEHGQGLVEDERVLQDRALAAMQIGAVTEHDAGVGVVEAAQVAGIVERIAGDPQGEELVRLAAVDRVRHDPELARLEAEQVLEIATGCGLDAARLQVALRIPRGRRLGDRVDAADDVAPERAEVGRLREQARHADDRDRLGQHVVARCGDVGRHGAIVHAKTPGAALAAVPPSRFSAALPTHSMPSMSMTTRSTSSRK
jgi:hypothetical protein